ncbi:DUF427 domain-containing protein [Streptomyces axinellae]|uniref:DUF427 domain-containing protein n=1 Tax=Streptomyces axinellae TaxID=552788 RepID=A0ABN3PSQ6_9ACTN
MASEQRSGHRIEVERGSEHVRVTVAGQVLAESSRPMLLSETGYPVRYYLPPEDVRTDLLTPSSTHTICPFKGTASYWSLPDGPEDVAWGYPDPLPAAAAVKDHLCFADVELL